MSVLNIVYVYSQQFPHSIVRTVEISLYIVYIPAVGRNFINVSKMYVRMFSFMLCKLSTWNAFELMK